MKMHIVFPQYAFFYILPSLVVGKSELFVKTCTNKFNCMNLAKILFVCMTQICIRKTVTEGVIYRSYGVEGCII